MIAHVLFPINAESFSYLVLEDLRSKTRTGSRVLAPFKRSEKIGIVRNTEQRVRNRDIKNIKFKTINSVLEEEPLIPQKRQS